MTSLSRVKLYLKPNSNTCLRAGGGAPNRFPPPENFNNNNNNNIVQKPSLNKAILLLLLLLKFSRGGNRLGAPPPARRHVLGLGLRYSFTRPNEVSVKAKSFVFQTMQKPVMYGGGGVVACADVVSFPVSQLP